MFTVIPLEGAGVDSVIVAVVELPPVTMFGFITSEDADATSANTVNAP